MPRNPKKTVSPAEPKSEPIEETAAVATIAPPKKKPVPPKPSDLVDEEIRRERRLSEAREELSVRRRTLLADGQDLTPDEMRVLKTAVPRSPTGNQAIWNRDWDRFLRHEDVRIGRVLDLQEAAGTPTDRSTADKLAATSQKKMESEAPAIQEKIRKLQNELGELHQAATSAKSAADARHAAVTDLRDEKLLPQFILDELAALDRCHTRDFGRELVALETRRIQLQSVFAMDQASRGGLDIITGQVEGGGSEEDYRKARVGIKSHVGGQARFGVDEMARLQCVFEFSEERRPNGISYRFGKIRDGVWQDYITDLRSELVDVEGRIVAITNGSQSAADAEVEALRSFYLPQD